MEYKLKDLIKKLQTLSPIVGENAPIVMADYMPVEDVIALEGKIIITDEVARRRMPKEIRI